MKKRVPLIKQNEEKDCGAACLSMILAYHGMKVPMAKVSEAIKVDRQGANLLGLHDGAAQFGLESRILQGSDREFICEVFGGQIKLPAIARIVNRHSMEHYVVVTKVTGNKIFCCDPDEGRTVLSHAVFGKCFLGHVVTFEKSEHFVKGNLKKGSVMEFIRLITCQKGLVALIGASSVLVTAISMAGTFLFRYLIDSVIPEIHAGMEHNHEGLCSMEIFALMLTAVLMLYAARLGLQLFRGKLLLIMSRKINLPLMLGYYNKVVDLNMEFFDNHQTGDLLTRFNDASKVQEALTNVTLTLMIDVPLVLICGFILFRQSGALFAAITAILALYITVTALYVCPMDRRNRQLMLENSRLNAYLKESLDNMQTVKAFNAGTTIKARTSELFHRVQTYGIKIAMLAMSKDALAELVTSSGTLLLLWMGSIHIAAGDMTLGTLMAFYTMLGYFLDPIQNVMAIQDTLQSAVVAAGRLRDILDRTAENCLLSDRREVFRNGDISLEDVAFRYGNRSLVLNHLNAVIHQGEKVAIVGSSGCGKTTVTKLIMGFYTPEQGSICIGGQQITDTDLSSLREHVAYVPQEVTMFSDTVRNNLLLGNNRQVPDAEIEKTLNAVGCDFVNKMPFGLDTVLDENGANLSGGQKQRLALVRALLRNPEILILDEATSALDTFSERKLQDALKKVYPSLTVIMVAHRLNSIRDCDRILVLDQGALAEEGSHAQLMQKNGLYAAMYNSMY